jgi:hypothetical protein
MGSRDYDKTCFRKILEQVGVWLDWVRKLIFFKLGQEQDLLCWAETVIGLFGFGPGL